MDGDTGSTDCESATRGKSEGEGAVKQIIIIIMLMVNTIQLTFVGFVVM